MIFVVAFDRRADRVLTLEKFDLTARADAEARYRFFLQKALFEFKGLLEVNMFEAADEATFRETHSRYFQTTAQTIDALRKAL